MRAKVIASLALVCFWIFAFWVVAQVPNYSEPMSAFTVWQNISITSSATLNVISLLALAGCSMWWVLK